ncbi:UDP-glucose 4-epimerase GalE [Sediminibacterium sp.]|jgi:UDP-glucose 4-epimerase|uniref:UDP-glucose 4-epimerase GalE n=1 Tax=Sediminibacterium sp. TaxID=1917865 RepID=UPI000BCA4367|nr:UDP-glucose 4-epimerase GalE [Sediminibacterium sp.]MDP3393296.1 UDP-glucose 4-epimerase GalE [Sediminibacterium sp.]MDP3567898.1 UDP-glucose 4-epimerase GalE [Sediminibacterium sp.]OYZ00751.1 MAG: UDP-glucose 4-epimerase GalE [Sphingobacteriia bacterium 28-36-52]
MAKILVTGGTGFIGSHTIVDLIENGYDVISIDNFARSTTIALAGIEKITGKKIKNYTVDLKNFDETRAVFQENTDIAGIIHFAAYKAVGESVEEPLRYYENNMFGLINLLKCVQEFSVPNFVFSSSCTVYGNPDVIPVTENTAIKPAESPYGATKQMGEVVIKDFSKVVNTNTILLRYFNPVGAHPSCLIGELPVGKPQNLVPAITQTAIGKLPKMWVHGSDYPTKDGSCVRDYIHVSDIAHAHTLAIQYLLNGKNETKCDVFNLGTGDGVSVLEAIHTFEEVSNVKLNYEIGPRRAGDVVAIYANNDAAVTKLGWKIKYGIKEMMETAWKWELKLKQEADQIINN